MTDIDHLLKRYRKLTLLLQNAQGKKARLEAELEDARDVVSLIAAERSRVELRLIDLGKNADG